MMWSPFLALFLLCYHMPHVAGDLRPELHSTVLNAWSTLDYSWSHSSYRDKYIADGRFVPENLQLSGLAAYEKYVYLTFPRVKSSTGVPFVLTRMPYDQAQDPKPWPGYSGHTTDDCNNLQNPLAIDIVPFTESLYALDTGRTGIASDSPNNTCGAKIAVYNVSASFSGSRKPVLYWLDMSVVSQNESVLAEMALDYTSHTSLDIKYAYIADGGTDRLIVYDFVNKKTWSFKHPTMGEMDNANITINGEDVNVRFGLNNLALSPDFNYLYYSSAGSKNLYQIPTWTLRKPGFDISSYVRPMGSRVSNSGGMYHGKDSLYYSALEKDAIYRWEARQDMTDQNKLEGDVMMKTQTPVAQNWETMQWPDTVSLDHHGYLWFLTNKAHLFYTDNIDFNDTDTKNYHLFYHYVGDYSYLSEREPDTDVIIG